MLTPVFRSTITPLRTCYTTNIWYVPCFHVFEITKCTILICSPPCESALSQFSLLTHFGVKVNEEILGGHGTSDFCITFSTFYSKILPLAILFKGDFSENGGPLMLALH